MSNAFENCNYTPLWLRKTNFREMLDPKQKQFGNGRSYKRLDILRYEHILTFNGPNAKLSFVYICMHLFIFTNSKIYLDFVKQLEPSVNQISFEHLSMYHLKKRRIYRRLLIPASTFTKWITFSFLVVFFFYFTSLCITMIFKYSYKTRSF